jgi:formylglycine-generating enzyme required for sulfatase activity
MRSVVRGLLLLAILTLAGYLAIPEALRAMGLHPHYQIPKFNLSGKRALIVTTSHDKLGNTGQATGVFGSEMTIPYYAFLDAGLTVDLASIKGGVIPIQPGSMSWLLLSPQDHRFLRDPAAMKKRNQSIPVAAVKAETYDVIFLAGGWGASYDLAQSTTLAELITRAHAQGAILGSVCHGALGLLNAKNTDGTPLLQGRRVTAVTDRQIDQLGIGITPLHPESALRAAKAKFEGNTAWRDFFVTHTVVDDNIVTGQNQNSSSETSHRILELLAAAEASVRALRASQLGHFLTIPGGGFVMGADPFYPEEGPPQRVFVSSFRLLAHEVTNSEFAAFVKATGYLTEAERKHGSARFTKSATPAVFLSWWKIDPAATWRTPNGARSTLDGLSLHPVVHVTLNDARAYAAWASGRIPTEVEWEYAASLAQFDPNDPESGVKGPGEKARANIWTGNFPVTDLGRDGFAGIAPVGSFPAGRTGAHDMIGNGPKLPSPPPSPASPSKAAPTCAVKTIAADTVQPPAKALSGILAPAILGFGSSKISHDSVMEPVD